MNDSTLQQRALEYLGMEARLVIERFEAYWQHGSRDTLRVPLPRHRAKRIHDMMAARFEVIHESGGTGQRTILTPQPKLRDPNAGVYAIMDRWMAIENIAHAIDEDRRAVRTWRDKTACTLEKRGIKRKRAGKTAIRMTEEVVDDLAWHFDLTLHLHITSEGRDVRPYELKMSADGEEVIYIAEEIGLSSSYCSGKLIDAGIHERPVLPTNKLRDWLRKEYDIELIITTESATA